MNKPISSKQQRGAYHFSETVDSLLAKYASNPPSLELHIHQTHFRFANQESVIPRNSPLIKIFLESVQKEQIPLAATEIFKDAGICFYEGCIILEIVDYRNVQMEHNTTENNNTNRLVTKSCRCLLRPTPLSIYHDLMYTTDPTHGRFTDQMALHMEAEILNLTVRNINLCVDEQWHHIAHPLIPNKKNSVYSSLNTANKALHKFREEGTRIQRPQHEDDIERTTEYEDLMLIMADREDSPTNKFQRFGFIEQFRKKHEKIHHQMIQVNQSMNHMAINLQQQFSQIQHHSQQQSSMAQITLVHPQMFSIPGQQFSISQEQHLHQHTGFSSINTSYLG